MPQGTLLRTTATLSWRFAAHSRCRYKEPALRTVVEPAPVSRPAYRVCPSHRTSFKTSSSSRRRRWMAAPAAWCTWDSTRTTPRCRRKSHARSLAWTHRLGCTSQVRGHLYVHVPVHVHVPCTCACACACACPLYLCMCMFLVPLPVAYVLPTTVVPLLSCACSCHL